jgi:glycosyltransferase involved in cell wall biosynthesis
MTAPFPTIGFDARLWDRTGIGRYIRNIAGRLRGVDLVVWALPQEHERVQAELPSAVVRVCPARPYSIGETFFWCRELRRVPLDLFHAPHINIPLGIPVPLVVTLHDLIPLRYQGAINSWLGKRYFGIMSRLALAQARRVIAVSETTRRDMVGLLRANPGKIRTIGEGADHRFHERATPQRLQALRDRFRLAPRYVLYAGQWKPHKNLGTLLAAFAELRRRHADVQLVLVGREDPKQPHVPTLIRRLGLEAAVVRTGYLRDEDDIVGLFQGASVLAHPSRYEGFGLPPLEAMAAGVPVVVSNAASLPEVVGDAGILVPPDDVAGWVTALERAILDPSLRERLIRAGLERSRRLTWDRAATETFATYQEVLHETAPYRAAARVASPWHLWNPNRVPRSSFGAGN